MDFSTKTGRYLISSRHTSSLFCISPDDGSVEWTLGYGSANNTFAFQDFNFTFQHDARWMVENDTHNVISLFDNGSNGFNTTASQSVGMVISLDLGAKTATLLSTTVAPRDGGILAPSQGNTQILSNGGVYHGWGAVAAVSETNAAGEPVLFAEYGTEPMNYRSYSYNWTGYPLDKPALAAPAQEMNASTPLIAYVSWNGATEVKKWRFWGSASDDGGFSAMETVDKAGFETRWASKTYQPHIFAEAVAGDGSSLGNSTAVAVSTIDGDGLEIAPQSAPLNDTSSPTSIFTSPTTISSTGPSDASNAATPSDAGAARQAVAVGAAVALANSL